MFKARSATLAYGPAWLGLAMPILGVLSARYFGGSSFMYGTVRTVSVILFGYAIARHQLFDIDFKLKWTLRRGSLAAMFIGVFLVSTQIAQNYFNAQGGIVLGGLITGLVLFALTPLQRVAERIANAAMPNVRDASGKNAGPETYRLAVEMALMDGVISRGEERALAKIAGQCGLDPERALEIREGVEDALAKNPGAA